MSLYAEYRKEREGVLTLEIENGFAMYRFNGDECYLIDIYVRPDFRKTGLASRLSDCIADIAKAQGCKFLTGSVCTDSNGVTDSLKALLAYGMRFYKAEGTMLYFYKEIQ